MSERGTRQRTSASPRLTDVAALAGVAQGTVSHVLNHPHKVRPETQAKGFFDIRLYGETASGKKIVTKVTGDRDPGYGSTAKMLAESALALLDVSESDTPGGFWTPATAMGDLLIDRLVEHAGLTFDVVD